MQGIIDGYFIEDEEIVLVDYKTDFVKRGEEDGPEGEGTVYLFVYSGKRNSVVRNIVVKNKSQRPNTYFVERFGL